MRTGNVILKSGSTAKLIFSGAYSDAKNKWISQKLDSGETCDLFASDMKTKTRKGEVAAKASPKK